MNFPEILQSIEHDSPYKFSFQLYDEYIHRGDVGLVIGPSDGPFRDFSLTYASWKIGPTGLLYACDPKGNESPETTLSLNPNWTIGIGNMKMHIAAIQALRDKGIELSNIEWLTEHSDAFAIKLPDRSVNCLIDHSASEYITYGHHPQSQYLSQVFGEYARVLKPGGRAIIQLFHGDKFELGPILEQQGFSWQHSVVEDAYIIPLSDKTVSSIQDEQNLLAGEIKPWYRYRDNVRFIDGRWWLLFDNPDYPCPDLYVAVKQ